ncbi:methyl-accepting chemotaxis protein [Rhizobiaceae bacterium BDR2-2]|uniref:Methyl-accepting chemotaxis protein n=1 Tax=Ectorhizobium quercum TaxID=2965071 RepID=A0AAE3MWN7_9HYPH|nr:methyl-accepting chemotaxis protein [Ectorhizobium quercum]MCX8995796.1 methyl-accepting chemotaxis protein [Ectorhizobium quercum]
MSKILLKSLAGKLILATGVAIAGVMLVSNSFLIFQTRDRVQQLTLERAEAEASSIANELRASTGLMISAARSMADIIGKTHAANLLDRAGVVTILKASTDQNPSAFGSWFMEEPQAFDGRTDIRDDKTLGTNANGVFTPYWAKDRNGQISLTTFAEDYAAAWYKVSRDTQKGAITPPYTTQDTDVPTLMTSISYPVLSGGRLIGVSGVDMSLASLSDHLSQLKPFGTGRVMLVSGDGKWLVAPTQDRLMQDYDGEGADLVRQSIASMKPVSFHATEEAGSTGGYQRVVLPFTVPDMPTTWAVLVDVPNTAIGAAVNEQTTLMVIGAIVVLGAVILALYLAVRSLIRRPIDSLVSDVARLGSGDYDQPVTGQNRSDEIGSVAKALEGFRHALAQSHLHEQEAAAHRRDAENQRNLSEADRVRSEELQRHIVSIVGEGLTALSHGRLSHRITEAFPGEYAKLRDDFNAAISSLEETIITVNSTIQGIGNGTGEISGSVSNLSQRTEQQAASLEETAAALNEITEQVNSSAQNAKSAATTVALACTDAEKSGEIVQRAITSMQGIERSSSQIGQIISVIDEIAFQTNLLALNAGVEAARAGDAGKGFAVVAQEVRQLAQRSADAAKEIRSLINASSTQVAEGVDLVGEAGAALEGISAQVMQISGLIREISQSASEQAVGLKEVNAAMNQMDQVTQHNAAMVEETTAASMALKDEAERLRALSTRFQVSGGSAAAPGALRETAAALRAAASPRAPARPEAPVRKPAPRAAAQAAENWEEF